MPRRLLAAFAAALLAAPAVAADPPRPNILWLIAEDLGPELNCYGYRDQVWTPNIDRLAAEGVRYTRAYTTAPVCSASRSAFMTGMYQTTIGAHNHRSHRDDGYRLPDGVRVLTEWLKDAGYKTANLTEMPAGFGFKGTGKTDWNFSPPAKPFTYNRWADLKVQQPFYAQINFHETHRPYKGAPKKADPAKVVIPPYYPDHPVTRTDWAQYLDATTELDRKVGLILKQLESDGLAENTLVLFIGDHGQSHVRGKQFCYEEGLHIPLVIRWPKGYPVPAGFKPGTVDDRLVEAIDFAPTMLSIAGVAKPAKMQGHVLFGEKADPPRQYAFGARDRCDETVFRFRTARDDRYRYIRNFTPDRPFLQNNDYKERSYPVWNLLKQLHAEGKLTPVQDRLCAPTMPPEELYDLERDPFEVDNLAGKPEHDATLKRFRGVVGKWIEESNDQGRTFEPPEVAANMGATKKANRKRQGETPVESPTSPARREPHPPKDSPRKPNVVVLLADDLGYGDVGFQGGTQVPTPRLDALAKSGVRCTSGYVSCPVCSPTRAGFLTGRYQQRFGHEFNPAVVALGGSGQGLPLSETTIPDRLKAAGYATGLVGKWHQGEEEPFHPLNRGFGEFFGFLWGAHSYTRSDDPQRGPILRGRQKVDAGDYLTRALAREACGFIDRHATEPFYLYLAFNAVHTPLEAPPETLQRFAGVTDPDRRTYLAMTAELDAAVGVVLDKLRSAGLDENTLVFFLSDNGGPIGKFSPNASANGPLRGSKGDTWEGGIRVPFVVRWTGHLPESKVYDHPIISLDIGATALAATGVTAKPEWKLDGVDLVPFLAGPNPQPPHDALYWRFGKQMAIRRGDWKLVRPDRATKGEYADIAKEPMLFNLADDIGERTDLATRHPDKVHDLQAAWDQWSSQMARPRWPATVMGKAVKQDEP